MFVLIGCILWLVVCAWVAILVQWIIGGEIDFITGVVGITVFIGLGITTMSPPVPEVQPYSAIAVAGSAVVWPFVRFAFHRRDRRDSEVVGVRKAYEGFVMRPNNPAAMIRLARHLWNLGVRGHAYALGETALPHLPARYYPDEHRMVAAWRTHPPRQSEFDPIRCIECGTPNAAGLVHCTSCGSRFLLLLVQGSIVSSGIGRKLLAAWIVMVIAIAGMPMATKLPGTQGAAVIVALMTVAILALALSFRPVKGKV